MPDTTNDVSDLTEETLAKALDSVRTRISEADEVRKSAEEAISKAREEERLLARLLALRSSAGPAAQTSGLSGRESAPSSEPKARVPAVAAAIGELEMAGRPLHISELMRLLKNRGVSIPGAGKQANLIAHMSRDVRIVRPTRGMYALATWGLDPIPAKKARRRRRVRVMGK